MKSMRIRTVIKEVYEKEVLSTPIVTQNYINNDDAKDITNFYEETVKNEYENGKHIVARPENLTENNFSSLIVYEGEADSKVSKDNNNLCANHKEIKEETVNFMLTVSKTYGASFDISYVTEEEKQEKISKLHEFLEDNYKYSDCGDLDDLEEIDDVDVDIDTSDKIFKDCSRVYDNYTTYNRFEEEFGEESINTCRISIECYTLPKTVNYIKEVLKNKKMSEYAEYLYETTDMIYLLNNENDLEYLKSHKDEIMDIVEGDEEYLYKLVFEEIDEV